MGQSRYRTVEAQPDAWTHRSAETPAHACAGREPTCQPGAASKVRRRDDEERARGSRTCLFYVPRGLRGPPTGRRLDRPLDLDVREPLEPARQVPAAPVEQGERARQYDRADDRRVEQERDGDAEAHLLEHHELPGGEAGEDDDDDQRRTGDDPRRRRDAPTTASCVEPEAVVALLDPAHQEHLVVHRQPEQHREEEERHPGVDHVRVLEAEQAGAVAVEEDERQQAVRGAHREQVEQDRDERDDDRAERDREQDEAQPEHEEQDVRSRVRHGVEVVDVLRGDARRRRPSPRCRRRSTG